GKLVTAAGKRNLCLLAGHDPDDIAFGDLGDKLSGAVRLVSPTVDPVNRLGLVHISIEDDSKARSGMYGSAEIIVRETEGVAL
ncbi:efflux transporter periplasmic adaptor subunit, partial [Rhizobium johnstonii]